MTDCYMDNWLSGRDSEDEATSKFARAKEIFEYGGMQLKRWDSNSQKEIQSLEERHLYHSEEKVLGIKLIPSNDILTFKNPHSNIDHNVNNDMMHITEKIIYTKRALLSTFASVYDPLGLVAPIMLVAKILFQEACKA